MHELRIQFTVPAHGIRVLSDLIRWVLGTKYSHVLARWKGAQGKVDLVWEASGSSIKFLGPIAHRGRYEVVTEYLIELNRTEYSRLIEYTHMYAHVDYGSKQLIGMLFARLFRLKDNPISRGENEQVCSEAVAGLLKYVKGWDFGVNFDVEGPDRLEQLIRSKLDERMDTITDS